MQNKMQHMKEPNSKINESSTVVQLGQYYYGENKNWTQDQILINKWNKLIMTIQWSDVRDSVTCISKVYKRNQQVRTNILLLTSEQMILVLQDQASRSLV